MSALSNPYIIQHLALSALLALWAGVFMGTMMIVYVAWLKSYRKKWNVVGVKDGRRYYQHKTKRRRTCETRPANPPDYPWLKFEREQLFDRVNVEQETLEYARQILLSRLNEGAES